MTREEEIRQAAINHICDDTEQLLVLFEEGAKWADEHQNPDMVNKQEFIENTVSYFTPILKTYCSEECIKELITGFVNSMEK